MVHSQGQNRRLSEVLLQQKVREHSVLDEKVFATEDISLSQIVALCLSFSLTSLLFLIGCQNMPYTRGNEWKDYLINEIK